MVGTVKSGSAIHRTFGSNRCDNSRIYRSWIMSLTFQGAITVKLGTLGAPFGVITIRRNYRLLWDEILNCDLGFPKSVTGKI